MNRRELLRTTAVGAGVATAGCLERLGFEAESSWSNQPLVEDRPDAVYLPASVEEMGRYATATEGDYGVALSYTIPHRFWLLAGDESQVDVRADDSLHLMATIWDRETRQVVPVAVSLDLRRDGESVERVGSPWPMLSQRMGFHYGDNVSLPAEGQYTARLRVGPVDADRVGSFADRLDEAVTVDVPFEFQNADVHDLSIDPIDEGRRGTRDALSLMDHGDSGDEHDNSGGGDHDGHDAAHPPTSRGPPLSEVPGDPLGTDRSGDAVVAPFVAEADSRTDAEAYLAVCLRTPYNDVILPHASLTATVEREGSSAREVALTEAVDDEFGHHYGAGIDPFADGSVTVSIDGVPQIARHDGYETAFRSFEDVTF